MYVLQNAKNASKTHQNPFAAGGAQNAPTDRLANVWASAPDPAGFPSTDFISP